MARGRQSLRPLPYCGGTTGLAADGATLVVAGVLRLTPSVLVDGTARAAPTPSFEGMETEVGCLGGEYVAELLPVPVE